MNQNNTPNSDSFGAMIFQGSKPAPPVANIAAISLLILTSFVVAIWTVPIMRQAQGNERWGNLLIAAFAHGGPLLCALAVWERMHSNRLGQLTFFEHGVTFGSGEKALRKTYKELDQVSFVEIPPQESAALSASFGLLIGNWARLGKAYADSKYHWRIVVKPIGHSEYSIKLPNAETFERLKSVVPCDKQVLKSSY
jgi:hypothetical protein